MTLLTLLRWLSSALWVVWAHAEQSSAKRSECWRHSWGAKPKQSPDQEAFRGISNVSGYC